MKRLDTADKVNGKQVYAIDLKLPGMLNAAIKDCPVFGGKVKSYDEAAVKSMPGVRHVVKVGESAVAVVADTWWQAKKALDALPIQWDEGENVKVSSATIAERLKEGLDATEAAIGQKIGDAPGAIASAIKKVEAVYYSPFVNHATMEPMNTTAKVTADRCEVWVPTQNGEAALAAAAEASGLPLAKCEVYKIHLGGGFGRRGAFHDYVKQAVLIAKQIPDVPIKMIWSREEDMLHGFFRPVQQCKLTAGLDDKDNLVGLHMRLSGPSILNQLFPQRLEGGVDRLHFQGLLADEFGYSIPNLLIDHAQRATHVPIGFWRGVNHNQNAIFMECFIDEMAHAAGQGPAGVPPRHDEEPSQASRCAATRRPRRQDGRRRLRPASSAASARTPASAAIPQPWPRFRWSGQGQGPSPRHGGGLRHCRQSGPDRRASGRLGGLRARARRSIRRTPSRTAASSRRTSTASKR